MIVAPLWVFGLFAVFAVAYAVTNALLEWMAEQVLGDQRPYRSIRNEAELGFYTRGNMEFFPYFSGGLAVALVILLLLALPTKTAVLILFGLVAIGVLFLLFVFAAESLSGEVTEHRAKNAQTRHEPAKERPKNRSGRLTKEYEAPTQAHESEQERQGRQAQHQAKVLEKQAARAELESIRRDLCSAIVMPEDQGEDRGKNLASVLNRLFIASDISLRERFAPVELRGQRSPACVSGAVAIDGDPYLVEMYWSTDPLDTKNVAPELVRLFNGGYAGCVLISSSGFTQDAIATCKDALSQKTVVLCELAEVVTLLEEDGSLRDLMYAKIAAAVVDKNPLVKPSAGPRRT